MALRTLSSFPPKILYLIITFLDPSVALTLHLVSRQMQLFATTRAFSNARLQYHIN